MPPPSPDRPTPTRRGFLARLAALTGGGMLAAVGRRAFAAPTDTQVSFPYIGEIRMVTFNFAPVGWLSCDGSLLAITQFESLFLLIGTTFGGDGQSTFALPDLRGRLPMHQGGGHVLGERGGEASLSLLPSQIPSHAHALVGDTALAAIAAPGGAMLARDPAAIPRFGPGGATSTLASGAIAVAGSGQSHNNMPPYLPVHFIIATEGVYPS